MKFVFIHEKVNLNGSTEQLSANFDQPEVVIGRGGGSHIILAGKRLSLTHAKLSWLDDRLTISDLESLAGVRVNKARVAQAVLSTGDEVQLGDLVFTVTISKDTVVITHRTTVEAPVSEDVLIQKQSRALSIDSYLPSMRALSVVLAVLVLAGCFVLPLSRNNFQSWNSGPISNAHKLIEKDCKRCHATSFQQVQDKECLACHTMTDHAKGHAKFVELHPDRSMRCAECHMEHNGDHGIVSKDPRQCSSCHAGMNALNKDASILDVVSFKEHPQFRIAVTDESGVTSQVSLDDTAKVVDTTPIKLNHAVHLKKGLRGPKGPTQLQCNACHNLAPDKKAMMPISFDRHCRDCHSLGFDERLPDSELPHGNAEKIYPTLFAEYAKLLLLEGKLESGRSGDKLRAIPGGSELAAGSPRSPDVLLVESDARKAEKEVFTRTGCYLCHNYQEKPESEQTIEDTRYTITKPHIPNVWMTKASFGHGAHEDVSCDSCHEKTRKSTETTDVLLPGIKVCRECHVDGKKAGFVRSDCVLCHVYHKSLEVPHDKKQDLNQFLNRMTR